MPPFKYNENSQHPMDQLRRDPFSCLTFLHQCNLLQVCWGWREWGGQWTCDILFWCGPPLTAHCKCSSNKIKRNLILEHHTWKTLLLKQLRRCLKVHAPKTCQTVNLEYYEWVSVFKWINDWVNELFSEQVKRNIHSYSKSL